MKRGVEAVMTSLAAKDGMGERVPLVRMKRYGAALRISRATETLGSMHHRLRVRPGGGGVEPEGPKQQTSPTCGWVGTCVGGTNSMEGVEVLGSFWGRNLTLVQRYGASWRDELSCLQ